MARNEEKQLARLNRFYLQQQREEELKKRPPRPRLDTLATVDDVKKWLPSILKDIDFYVKQMEVPCYPKRQIEEFERRIDKLRGEYKAFVQKIRRLEPDIESTPWTDRPYKVRRKNIERKSGAEEQENDTSNSEDRCVSLTRAEDGPTPQNFVPIATPVLNGDDFYKSCYGYQKPKEPVISDTDLPTQNEPLQLAISWTTSEDDVPSKLVMNSIEPNVDKPLEFNWNSGGSKTENNIEKVHKNFVPSCDRKNQQQSASSETQKHDESDIGSERGETVANIQGILNIPYSDSSSDEDT